MPYISIIVLAVLILIFMVLVRIQDEVKEEDIINESVEHDPLIIQAFVNERWTLQADIRNASTKEELETCRIRIETLYVKYYDTVPNEHLMVQIDSLKAYYNIKKEYIL